MAKIDRRAELLRKLAAMSEEVRAAVKPAIRQGADEVVAMQKRLAPVKTGWLRASIRATYGGALPRYASMKSGAGSDVGDPDLTVTITAGSDIARYAHLVEFGASPHTAGGKFEGAQHPGAKAQPFFYPGYRATKRRVKTRISRAMGKAVRGGAT